MLILILFCSVMFGQELTVDSSVLNEDTQLQIVIEPDEPHEVDTDALLNAVVLVAQGRAACAGAFINDQGWVLTAYHCIAGEDVQVSKHGMAEERGKDTNASKSRSAVRVSQPSGDHLPVAASFQTLEHWCRL